jgi:copper chaperone
MNTSTNTSGDSTPGSTVTLSVPGMTCGHCKAAIETELGKVPGVASVAVDLDAKLVAVVGTALDHGALVAAVDEAGFDVAD